MMGHSTQLARWLHKQLALKFTFASIMHSFEVRYRTILRDSALLNGYTLARKAIKAVDDASHSHYEDCLSGGTEED
jgi:hypothetical protein